MKYTMPLCHGIFNGQVSVAVLIFKFMAFNIPFEGVLGLTNHKHSRVVQELCYTKSYNNNLHVFLLWLMVVWSKFPIILTLGYYARCWRKWKPIDFIWYQKRKQMRIKQRNSCNNHIVLLSPQTIVQLCTFCFID